MLCMAWTADSPHRSQPTVAPLGALGPKSRTLRLHDVARPRGSWTIRKRAFPAFLEATPQSAQRYTPRR
eukprot:6277608-Prymnesium_polylepis.1